MLDPLVQRLLEQAIDTPIKLQLLLMFCDNPRFCGTPQQIAERIYRDIWSTKEALSELAGDGILSASEGIGGVIYRYRPAPEHLDPIERLYQCYNEPLERDQLQQFVREAAKYAPYRRAARGALQFELR